MRKNYYDESILIDVKPGIIGKDESYHSIEKGIRSLCEAESFAVLATQSQNQPYANLIGYAISEDMKYLVFGTPIHTRKYNFISGNEQVSLLIDDRSKQPDRINQISAVTIIGKASLISDENFAEAWRKLLVDKHPYMRDFVKSKTTSLILVEISKYIYVRRFQEVFEWMPAQNS